MLCPCAQLENYTMDLGHKVGAWFYSEIILVQSPEIFSYLIGLVFSHKVGIYP